MPANTVLIANTIFLQIKNAFPRSWESGLVREKFEEAPLGGHKPEGRTSGKVAGKAKLLVERRNRPYEPLIFEEERAADDPEEIQIAPALNIINFSLLFGSLYSILKCSHMT